LYLAAALIAPIGAFAAEYRIGPQERVRVKVYEWPALSDDFIVSPEGVISLPIIGSIKVADMTVADLADSIASQLQARAGLPEKPFASVEITQFRPYYVIGDVQRSGDFVYRPNMTVLIALSIAGGPYRAADGMAVSLARDAITSRSTLALLEGRKLELLVRQARLNAELLDKDAFELKPGVEYPAHIIQEERAIMQARRDDIRNQISGLRNQVKLYWEEIALLKARSESGNKKISSLEKELTGLRSLSERGLGLASRQGELDRLAAQYEGDQREIDTLINRARQNIAQAETSTGRLMSERQQSIRIELRQVSTQLDDLEQQMAMQQDLLAGSERMGAVTQAQRLGRFSFRISRRTSTGVTELDVQQSDAVEPGDVVIVKQLGAGGGIGSGILNRELEIGVAQSETQR
jgi:protein involved in polysaccharide export with SLBB domain/predicted RNase H-like nuclease (RuvC/YqgF family)